MGQQPNRLSMSAPSVNHINSASFRCNCGKCEFCLVKIRRQTAPGAFNADGSYKRWLHVFNLADSTGTPKGSASVEAYGVVLPYVSEHYALPWELEHIRLSYRELLAYWNLGAMTHWHNDWRYFPSIFATDAMNRVGRPDDTTYWHNTQRYWMLLPLPGDSCCAQVLASKKRELTKANKTKLHTVNHEFMKAMHPHRLIFDDHTKGDDNDETTRSREGRTLAV